MLVADRDASGQPMLDEATVSRSGEPGTDLTLTIDAGLQLGGAGAPSRPGSPTRPSGVSAVVIDPYTGAERKIAQVSRRELLKLAPILALGAFAIPKLQEPLLKAGLGFSDWVSARCSGKAIWLRPSKIPN